MENWICRDFFVEHDSIPLHVRLDAPGQALEMDRGNGRRCPLVIVQHGFTGHMEERHIVGVSRALNEAGFATLRTELYGHGKSGGHFQDHTLFKWLSEMMTIVDYAKKLEFVSDLYLCGHSQGGLLVMLAGAMEQDRIRAVIALSPAAMIPEQARKGVMLGMSFDPVCLPEVLEMENGLRLGSNYLRAAQALFVEPAIDAYRKPILIIHGDSDETIPLQVSVDAANRYSDAKLVVIPGDNHCYDCHLDLVESELKEYMKQFS